MRLGCQCQYVGVRAIELVSHMSASYALDSSSLTFMAIQKLLPSKCPLGDPAGNPGA